ncbi:MAG: site-specific integrase [Verrucomicrobiota bacterium]|nr:site-specific integrase [Verrucomicrobiota bacterium]
MASFYERKGSPYYWIRFQKCDGSWGGKSSGIRKAADGARRKIKQAVAQETMREHTFSEQTQGNRFDAWVPGFLARKYSNEKTLIRYQAAWSAISTYLAHRDVSAPAQVTYQLCIDYPAFRTEPPKELMKARSHNTALTELKVFSAIMQEAVRRGYITANPALRLGLKRNPAKQKPEVSADEQALIETALKSRDEWMRDCWLVAMRQGCRLSETAVPLREIDVKAGTITFRGKGNRVHCAPLHQDLRALVNRAIKQKRATLVLLPKYAAKAWFRFFRQIGLRHLCFHSTRVTVVTRLARAHHPMYETKAYVGHASDTVHAIYLRLSPPDVRHLGAALSA